MDEKINVVSVMKSLFFSVVGILAISMPAFGHSKWFVEYDLQSPPKKIKETLLAGDFMTFFFVTLVLVLIAAAIDTYMKKANFNWVNTLDSYTQPIERRMPLFLRFGTFVFMLSIAQVNGVYLTPELKTDAFWVSWLQLCIAICVLHYKAQIISGIGILILYGAAINQYGMFHLLDYPIFLGVACYLIIDSLRRPDLMIYRDVILRVSMAVSLLWASIEKWAFPEWSFELLEQHKAIMMGMDVEMFMVVAGFVEFIAAFMLLAGQVTARLAAIVLLFFIIGAIPLFGMIDAVGHSEIIFVLFVLLFSKNPLGSFFNGSIKRMPTSGWLAYEGFAARASLTLIYYALAVLGFCVWYYASFYFSYLYF